ncbi:hypothetical protein, conserved [Leishmania tarentolae]|uniref:Flagellar attachment zone protein 1 conserved domain-containing protein n=1 Tax=Leishmania tarentolae TaxID=5689 RepID=A0A640KJZ8_LEITA|nr:hypothetical protein, conserved [Leishmania tarentolae]
MLGKERSISTTEMSIHNAEVYSDAVDVLKILHDTVETYVSLMHDSEDEEREFNSALGSASSSSLATSGAVDLAITRQHIQENAPRLLEVCASVRNMLCRAAMLARQSSERSDSKSLSTSGTLGNLTAVGKPKEVVHGVIARKLGDITENVHMIRGIVKLQQQQQYSLSSPLPRMPLTSPDDNDGPLLMKQLIRVTLYNLEDLERLLQSTYPDAPLTSTVNVDRDVVDVDRPTLFLNSPRLRRTLPRSHGQRFGYNVGGVNHEGRRDSTGCRNSTSSGDGGGVNSLLQTPRSSTHTAPYVQRSPSLDQANLLTSSSATVNHEVRDSDSEAALAVRMSDTAPTSPTGTYPSAPILLQSQQADTCSTVSSFIASATKPSSPRVCFDIGELSDSEDEDSSLSTCTLAFTAVPTESSPGGRDLLSNPVVRLSSADKEKSSPRINKSGTHATLSSGPLLSSKGSGTVESSSLGYQHLPLATAQHPSPFSAAVAPPTLTEAECLNTGSDTPTVIEEPQSTVPFFEICSDRIPDDSANASALSTPSISGSLNSSAFHFGDSAPSRSRNGNSNVSGRGSRACALLSPVGLPPRSPRRHDPQQHSTDHISSSRELRLPLAPDPVWVDPSMRVKTYHMQQLPGELWGVIIEEHRSKMEAAFRDDVLSLFNYGKASPLLRGEDVCRVDLTVVGTDLHIRIELEHLCALAESEINTRLNLCSYPLMTQLYEDFFKEHQRKEFDLMENSTKTPDSDTSRYCELYSNCVGDAGDEEEKSASDGSVEQRSFSPASSRNASEVAAGESNGDVGKTEGEAVAAVAPCVPVGVDSRAYPPEEGTTTLSALRHPHTVRIPGAHWERLLLSPVSDRSHLKAAFVQDTGMALGVLPSEAREACQEVHFSLGSLVVDFVWDNAELYPGAVPLSAPEIDTALQNCPYPSLRAFYTDVCTALHLDDDLGVNPVVKLPSRSGDDGTVESIVVQATLPNRVEIGLASGTDGALEPDRSSNAEKEAEASVPNSSCGGDLSAARLPMAPQPAQTENVPSPFPPTVETGLYAANSKASTSGKVDSPQQQCSASLPPFRRMGSATSNASAEAVPRIAVPQPTVGLHIHSSRGPKQRRVHSRAGTPRTGASATSNAHAPNSRSSKAAGRRAVPASSQEPATLNQFALVHGVSIEALRQWNPALADLDADVIIPVTATVYVPRLSLSPGRARAQTGPGVPSEGRLHRDPSDSALADITSDNPHRPTARLPAPASHPNPKAKEAAPSSHAVASSMLQRRASEPEKGKRSTIPISKNTTAGVLPRRSPPRSVEDAEKRGAFTPATVRSANAPTAAPAAELAPRISPFSMTTTGSQAPPDRTPYQLLKPQTSKAAEPRRVKTILSVRSAPPMCLGGAGPKAAVAADYSACARAVDEDHCDDDDHKEEADRSMMLLEHHLGLLLDNLTVVQVRHNSVAARANVQPGDTLRTMNGKALLCRSDFEQAIAQQYRKEDEEYTLFVTAMTSRGTPVTYRLRLPALPCESAVAQTVLSLQRSLRDSLPLAAQKQTQSPPRRVLPLSARMPSAGGGNPRQQCGLQSATQCSAKTQVERAESASARSPVSSRGAAAQYEAARHDLRFFNRCR